jgi:Zn-dependent peptidase ImmA (M78 family)
MKTPTTAEKLLISLGITEPGEIDLEAIAWTLGVKVKFKPLDGCEARIVGMVDSAVVTVNSRSTSQRQRFSIAHELGHWEFHRGKVMVCRQDEIGSLAKGVPQAEKKADRYAADLVMPRYLFRPAMRVHKQLDFNSIRMIADQFETSLTATAIRIIDCDDYPAILICHNQSGRRWFSRSNLVPSKWFPRDELQPESSAMDILYGQRQNDSRLRSISADAWFDRYDAHKYEIYEQTWRLSEEEIFTLLIIDDEEMLEE